MLEGHRGNINSLAYGNDGRLLTAGADATARVWPVEGDEAVVLTGHTREVSSVAFWADADVALTTSFDGTLRAWDSRTGHAMGRLVDSGVQLVDLAVAPDGTIAYLDEKSSCGSSAARCAAASPRSSGWHGPAPHGS